MKYTKILFLIAVIFPLFGCNGNSLQAQADKTSENLSTSSQIKASPQSNSSSQTIATPVETSTTPSRKNQAENPTISTTKAQTTPVATKQKKEAFKSPKQDSSPQFGTMEELRSKIGNGKIIGSAACDDDGIENDVRVDFDGDGMPDKCVVANLKIEDSTTNVSNVSNISIDETSYQTVTNSLAKLTENCQESEKVPNKTHYTICTINGKPVSATESHIDFGDGLSYWFQDGQVVAARRLHNGDTFVFDRNGKLSSMFVDNQNTGKMEKVKNISSSDRQDAEGFLYNGYKQIFEVFNI